MLCPGVSVFTDKETDKREVVNNNSGEDPIKPGFLDIVALTIAAFQILIPYLIVFILAILLVPGIFYLISFLTNR